MPKHLLSVGDLSTEEILHLIELAIDYKKIRKMGIKVTGELAGKTVALIFEKPSTRTRASFSVAVYEMGGLPIVYSRDELQLARGEPVKDVARVLSRYHDAIAARVYRHCDLEELRRFSTVPVINLLSDVEHPLQALADYMTILERFGTLKGIKLAFVGDGRDNVFNSLAIAGLKLGVEVRVACPKGYEPNIEQLVRAAGNVSGKIEVFNDPFDAVRNADVVYTDVFVSMGQETEREIRMKTFLPRYKVTKDLMNEVGKHAVFMHCLPAHRGEEVEEEVLESSFSIVFEQAENRLHTSKAVLRYLLVEEPKT